MKIHLHIAIITLTLTALVSCTTTQQAIQPRKSSVSQATNTYEKYILTYYPIAVEQMHRHNIPASITLAQGLLESGAGGSTLTRNSNNHFGIKASSGWRGKTTSHMDNGKMCKFRVYDSARESYEDHSQFLKKERYAALFKLSPTDYKGWARGLKKAGYAEDPAYPQKLINLIERYNLQEYDHYSKKDVSPLLAGSATNDYAGIRPIYRSSGLLYIIANTGDTFKSLSNEFGISRRKLIKYNDLYKGYALQVGDILYLEQKNKRADEDHIVHVLRAGESMYSIAQKYGIRLKNLYKLNKMNEESPSPKVGTILRLR